MWSQRLALAHTPVASTSLLCPVEAAEITVAVIYGAHMKRRDKGSNGEVGGEVEIFSTGRGVLVEGNPSDVSVFIDQMLAVTREAGGQSRHLVVDGVQLAANWPSSAMPARYQTCWMR